MKKMVLALVVLLAAVQMKADDAIKVFNNQMFDAPIISVINTNTHYEYLIVKEADNGKMIMRKKISNQVDLHEKMPYAKNGEYTIELIKGDEVVAKNVEVVDNKVVLNKVNVDAQGLDNIKFFMLDGNKTLLTSYHSLESQDLYMSIREKGSSQYSRPKFVDETNMLSNKKSISNLKEGVTYVATLYAGDTAYSYEFTR